MKPQIKDYAYYSDLYDKATVDHARVLDSKDDASIMKNLSKIENKERKEEYLKVIYTTTNLAVYFYIGERYLDKERIINKWIERDKAMVDFYNSFSKSADGTYCPQCHVEMEVVDKDLHYGINNKPDRIVFMMECKNCQIKKGVYDNGEEWISFNKLCKKCRGLNVITYDRDDKVITMLTTCSECGHTDKEIFDLDELVSEDKPDPYFDRDRRKYCLSAQTGEDYIKMKANFESLNNVIDDIKERDKNQDLYDKVAQIKKLKVAELKDLLIKSTVKKNYSTWQFSNPEIDRYVIIGFTVEDTKSDREEYDSENQLKRAINQLLKDTNWRLMSEGISSKLGVLTGRLKGYENEEDLLKLVK